MRKQHFIRPFLASLMMLVMIFAITPKRTVHEIFGCHDTTSAYQHHKGKETSFNKDGFHCACEHQEFQTSFIEGVAPMLSAIQVGFSTPVNIPIAGSFHSTERSIQLLRGPPLT